MRDLEMLASEYGDEETRAAAAVALLEREEAAAAVDDAGADAGDAAVVAAEPSPLDDTFVRTFVRGAVHIRRFAPYYFGAAAWVIVMLLMAPQGRAPEGGELAGFTPIPDAPLASSAQTSEAPTDLATPAPGFSDIAAVPADSSIGFAAAPAGDGGAAFSDTSVTSSPEFSSSFSDSAALAVPDEPEPLRIKKSGYSSRTGGTPLEQEPPGNGLPVGAVGGEATKRSFIELEGDETVIKLKLIEDSSNVGAEAAGVRVCPIVTEWQAERGVAMDAEPAWSTPCVDGTRAEDGVWTFDLSAFGSPGTAVGFALTAGTAPGLSFNLTFDPSPVRSS